ncbi:MAG: hypothetical protein KF795_03445 [Labilithrix sp.]|nr:hypothetical protein [Labilithrix sp.]
MRWVVEVSSLGKTDLQKFCVEAESWQRALQAARAQRGEEGPMSGFSIELLDEGYRAVDPVARVRFVVKRAPDDMPVTTPLAKDAKGGVAPSRPSAASPSAAPATSAAPAAAAAAVPSAPATEPGIPPSPGSSSPATSTTKSVPPRPLTATDKGANGPSSKKGLTFGADAGKDTASASKPAPAAAAPAAVGSALPGLPPVKVLSSREQNPTDASPLTYREYSFAVPPGTSEDVAVQVLRGQLALVDAHLADAKMGKLVNLAVFDVEFTGKPPSPPVATLSWKDWKGDPVIGYPRRGAGQKQVKPPSATANGPASTAAPSSSVFPPPSSMPPGIPRPGAQAAVAACRRADRGRLRAAPHAPSSPWLPPPPPRRHVK